MRTMLGKERGGGGGGEAKCLSSSWKQSRKKEGKDQVELFSPPPFLLPKGVGTLSVCFQFLPPPPLPPTLSPNFF